MTEMPDDLKKEAWSQIKHIQPVFLATAEGDQPRVRPVTLIHSDKKLWITTGTTNAKVKQIRSNPRTEISWYFGERGNRGSLRIAGTARIVEDRDTKARIANLLEFFDTFWESVDDPNYTLLQISPEEIEYTRPGEFEAHRMTL